MSNLKFEYRGIGKILQSGNLRVPPNQREYSWEKENAADLCLDIAQAIDEAQEQYFLGTIVLTKDHSKLEVVDGQQRLATVTMLIAAIRDIYEDIGEEKAAESINTNFLYRLDRKTQEEEANLVLNTRDHEFYLNNVVLSRNSSKRAAIREKASSNVLIQDAKTAVRKYLDKLRSTLPPEKAYEKLEQWLDFIEDQAMVIVLETQDDINAYVMFETLNDRGLRVSKADLVKNYLFGKSGNRLSEVKERWSNMISSLEVIGADDTILDFLRYYCTLEHGLTREKDLFRVIKRSVGSMNSAVTFTDKLKDLAPSYAAILSTDHPKWKTYPPEIKRALRTLAIFNISQIRCLLLAISYHFSKKEAEKAMSACVCWIVRLLVGSTGKVGRVEDTYAKIANDIHCGRIPKTARAIEKKITASLATDEEFEIAFSVVRVSKAPLARYYLEALERHEEGLETIPELVVNPNPREVNLEHIIPQNPSKKWNGMSKDECNGLSSRLGNLALMLATDNVASDQAEFEKKKDYYEKSDISWTYSICDYDDWGKDEIDDRQEEMAKAAVKCWPLQVR